MLARKMVNIPIHIFFFSKLSLSGTPMNNNVINNLFSLDLPLNTLSSWHLRKSKTLTVPSSLQLANLESVGQKLWNLKVKKMWFGSLFIHLNIIKNFKFRFCSASTNFHPVPGTVFLFSKCQRIWGESENYFLFPYFILFYLG